MIEKKHRIRPLLVLKLALGLSLAFVGASLGARLLWVTGNLDGFDATANKVLNVDAEGNPPTWFASSLLLTSGLLAFAISFAVATKQQSVWRIFAGLVVFVSADEAASLHEKMISPIRSGLDTGGVFHFAWVIVAIPAVVIAAMALKDIFTSLDDQESRVLKVAFASLVVGAIGGEMASGPFADRTDSVTYILITHAEEGFEFFGASVLLFALLATAGRVFEGHTITLARTNEGHPAEITSGQDAHP